MQHLPCDSLYSFLFIPHCILVFSSTLWYLTLYSYPSPLLQSCNWLLFIMCNHFLSSSVSCTYFFLYFFSMCIFAKIILNADSVLQHCHPSQLAVTWTFGKWALPCGSWEGSEAVQGTRSRRDQREVFLLCFVLCLFGEQHVVRPGSTCSPTDECISRSLAVRSAEQCLAEPSSSRPGF